MHCCCKIPSNATLSCQRIPRNRLQVSFLDNIFSGLRLHREFLLKLQAYFLLVFKSPFFHLSFPLRTILWRSQLFASNKFFSTNANLRVLIGLTASRKTAICVNFALINEIMLFEIISALISRITWSLPLVYSVYFGKICRFIHA